MSTRRSGAATGSGLNSSASTIVNSAVLKPMPIASEATATTVNPGLFSSQRNEKRTSARNDSSKAEDYSPPGTRHLRRTSLGTFARTPDTETEPPPDAAEDSEP